MRYARPQFNTEEAEERLGKSRFARLSTLLGATTPPPLRLELVYVPHFMITIPVAHREKKSTVTAAIEACSGAFTLRNYTSDLLTSEAPERGDELAPRISEEEAVTIARAGIIRNALRARGGRRSFKWAEPESVELLQHPFWVYYHRRRRGFIDIRLLDAVTGDRPGSKTKGGILDAFVEARGKSQPASANNAMEYPSE